LKVITNKHGSNDYQLEFEKEYLLKAKTDGFSVQTEYGRWMLELVPSSPLEDYLYSGNLRHAINQVYKQLEDLAKDDNKFLTSTLPPKFGTLSYANHYLPGLDHKQLAEMNKVSGSQFMADAMINEHPRSLTSTSNVIERRGDKPFISAPIYPDTMTDLSRILPGEKEPGKIYLDSAMFGNGMTCLQVTVGTSDVSEARWLYDQLHVFTPIWLALSASSPFHKGTLLKTDTRWDILCQANDERNERERLPGGIQHSRYGPISMYISEDPRNFECYNDERKTLNK
jgi:glutamate--cysteine ligase catalytic subunit